MQGDLHDRVTKKDIFCTLQMSFTVIGCDCQLQYLK